MITLYNILIFSGLLFSVVFISVYATVAKWFKSLTGWTIMGLVGSLAFTFLWLTLARLHLITDNERIFAGIITFAAVVMNLLLLNVAMIRAQVLGYRARHPKQ